MNAKKNIDLSTGNGWRLCPSKSFPGKFYYFNVLNGETAWSLNQNDTKDIKKESSFHKITDNSHGYPEPTTLPDETTPISHNIFADTQRPQFLPCIPNTPQLPTFGQAVFPRYAPNEPLIPNIVWTSIPFPMLCPDKKPMCDKVTQISDTGRIAHSTNIPLSERFKNYESPVLNSTQNKFANPLPKYDTSTPKNSFLECIPESQNLFPKPLIKESTLKLEPKLRMPNIPIVFNSNEKPIISVSSKFESATSSTEVPQAVPKDQVLEKLENDDLRFLLLAKRRLETSDAAVERKKTKQSESKPLTLKKKPLTTNQTVVTPALSKDENTTFFVKDIIPKTPPPRANDQPPIFLPTAVNQSPTAINQSPTAIKQRPTATNQSSDAINQRPTATNQSSNATNQSSDAINQLPTAINQRPKAMNQQPTYKSTTWYVVVDTDVLLLDYELIDNLVLSDPKCRLVIPYAVAASIEALCMGNCHGQQRVIKARQLTRKLTDPPPYYIAEPRTQNNCSLEVTTESILQCCMKAANKNYYVVLITNDPHLQLRASLQNIPSYKLNDIKYGVDIKPHARAEPKNIQINNSNHDMNTKNLFQQNLSQFSNLQIKQQINSQEKTLKMTPRIDVQEKKNQNDKNFGLFQFGSQVRKQRYLSDSESDDSASDKLINITKQKCMQNIENDMTRPDSDGLSDISSEVSSINLRGKNMSKPQNSGRNPFLPGKCENQNQNPVSIFTTYNVRKTIPNEKVLTPNLELNEFQKDSLEYNFENTEKVFCSIPITNLKQFQPNSKPNNLTSRQEPLGCTRNNKTLNPSQSRIKKIIETIDLTTKTQFENTATTTKDSTGIFKIPKVLPIKNVTRNTSVQAESSTANGQIGTRTTIESVEEGVKRFRIKSENMMTKIKTRIDEWKCCYMQIMEEALVNILEKNTDCMQNTAAPLTLKDTLNCIKMLFNSHTKIREIIDKLSELLDKCMICVQGQIKLSIAPEIFMKLFGYGVLLLLSLKIILPKNEELKEALLLLSGLQANMENNLKEEDPELVKSPSVGCAEVDHDQEDIRPPFIKKRSFAVEYLKKHYKAWENYNEDLEDRSKYMIENHTDFKVVRTCGKNLSLLKLDRKKTMSLSKNTIENDKGKGGPKIIRLLENNQIMKPHTIATNQTTNNVTKTKLLGLNSNQNDFESHETDNVPLKKFHENRETEINIESNTKEGSNHTSQENSILEGDGPKIVINVEKIDEFEKKIVREPLDLDLLDYSEIYEPSINEVDFDIISEKNKKSEDVTNVDENNFGLTDVCTIDDFYITPSVSNASKITEKSSNKIKNITSGNNNGPVIQEKNSNEVTISETYTEKDSLIEDDNSKTPMDISETHLDNSDSHISEKAVEIVQDSSTNDSGIENESTYAHSMIKIFLHELSTTFTEIKSFVMNSIEEIHETKISKRRLAILHNQATEVLADIVAIIEHLKGIIIRESPDDTPLKRLLRQAGVEAATDKRVTLYRQIVIKCLEQCLIVESALKTIVSTTIADYEALPIIAESLNSKLKYYNIFE